MKEHNSDSIFKYKWDQVVSCFWNRYPNPYSNHVLSEDTVSRYIEDGKLHSTRLVCKTSSLPKWGEGVLTGPKTVYTLETSIVDPLNRMFTTITRNIGLTKLMIVTEECKYVDGDSCNETICHRKATTLSNVTGLSGAIERFGINRYQKHAHKFTKGFEHVLSLTYPHHNNSTEHSIFSSHAEKWKNSAKKATEIAKSRAVPVMAQVTGGTAAN